MTTAKLRNSTGNSLRISGGKIVTRYIVSTEKVYNFAIHPNGRDIAWASVHPTNEGWVIENALAPRRPTR